MFPSFLAHSSFDGQIAVEPRELFSVFSVFCRVNQSAEVVKRLRVCKDAADRARACSRGLTGRRARRRVVLSFLVKNLNFQSRKLDISLYTPTNRHPVEGAVIPPALTITSVERSHFTRHDVRVRSPVS